jgi:hypothetical protein
MTNIKIIKELEDENLTDARDSVRSILNQKVAEMLDMKKTEVGFTSDKNQDEELCD